MTRVLFDAHHLGQRQTGNETWARNIIGRLERHLPGCPVTYAVTAEGKAALRTLTDADCHVVSGSSARRLAFDLPRLVRKLRPDVVFTQYTTPAVRTRSVVLVHDVSFEEATADAWLSARTRTRYRASFRWSARLASRLLTVSEFTRQAMVRTRLVDADQVTVAPNAVDPVLGALIDAGPACRTGTTVLVVGNVLPRKNLGAVTGAVAGLRAAGLPVRLRVVGQVPRAGAGEAGRTADLLGDAVSFTGYVEPSQLAAEYLTADVLAFPSLYEGFGIPALEAMYAGLPVVVSDRAALPEVVGPAGLVVPADDVPAWERALSSLLRPSQPGLAESLIAKGRQRVASYDWDTSAAVTAGALLAAAASA